MVKKELWVYLLAHNLIRSLMAQAASSANINPQQLSFKHTLQLWAAWQQQNGGDAYTFFNLLTGPGFTLTSLVNALVNAFGRLEIKRASVNVPAFQKIVHHIFFRP